MSGLLLLLSILLPAAAGLAVAFVPYLNRDRKIRNLFCGATLLLETALMVLLALDGEKSLLLLHIEKLPIALKSDRTGIIFALVMTALWTISGFFSFSYMSHEKNERQYYSFYLLTLSSLAALCFASTLVTMYLFFELMTLLSLAMVTHTRTEQAVSAGIKYLIYSIAGATMGLLGIFYLIPSSSSAYFVPGGSFDPTRLGIPVDTMLGLLVLTIIGFATKAGMFPLHGWLPTAHPVAPAPASAVLSGVITKAGVLCVVRIIFYSVGVDFLRGTWAQSLLLAFAVLTVFMGSMLALKEKQLKKRLAYSSVSQLSYVLCGLFLLDATAFTGSMLHVVFHALIKNGLFLCAGAIIIRTGLTYVDDLKGLGHRMPIVFWCFTLCSLGLIGIPPTGGFISKWYIAQGAIAGQNIVAVFTWLVPAVLLVSALLTAGYLLPISLNAFFAAPKEDEPQRLDTHLEPGPMMVIPLVLLAAAVVVFGLFPGWLIRAFEPLGKLLTGAVGA